jgi:hypothetical protein
MRRRLRLIGIVLNDALSVLTGKPVPNLGFQLFFSV